MASAPPLLFASCKKDNAVNEGANLTSGSAKNSATVSGTVCTDLDVKLGNHSLDSWWAPNTVVDKACKTYTGDPGKFTYDWISKYDGTIGGIAKTAKFGSPGYPKTIATLNQSNWYTSG
jgi:hypothetical protein